jgi:hypothetical protein
MDPGTFYREERSGDQKTQVRGLSALFAQDQRQDRQTPQPRNIPKPCRSREARASGTIFQESRWLSLKAATADDRGRTN